VDNSSGSGATPNLPPIIATPKKKFGGGKMIATILGVLLLVGGIGAGIILTQQPQLFQQKAFVRQGTYKDTCNLVEVTAKDTGCPELGFNSGKKNNVPTYTTSFTIKNITSDQHVVSVLKNSNWCPEPYGKSASDRACHLNPVAESVEITLAAGKSQDIEIQRSSPSGTSCGSYQTDLVINAVDGNTNCTGGRNGTPPNIITWGLCQTGTECASPTPSPSPGTSQCLSVKAYDTSWNVLSDSALSNLLTGTQIKLCVAGSDSPDKAQFKINDTLEPETTSVRPSSTDFCQDYTILPTDTTVNVKVKIHYPGQGWFGEDI
jgi:hypothetical protein